MKINCIAIDDEPLALDIISTYASKLPYLNLMKTFDSALESLEFLKTNQVDVLFLDIQMDEITGIQLLNILKNKPLVIFTTAYSNYAINGFELDAVDYLLKPISFERFVKAVDKVFERIQKKTETLKTEFPEATKTDNPKKEFFFVKTEFRIQRVDFNDILYIEGQGDYLRIITTSEKIMTLMNFKQMEECLPANNFIRVHKSYIIALSKVENIERNRIKISDQYIPISETYRKAFFDKIEA